MVPGIGFFEMVVIFMVIYLMFGPQGMVDTAKTLARLVKTVRREIARIQHELQDESPPPRLAPDPEAGSDRRSPDEKSRTDTPTDKQSHDSFQPAPEHADPDRGKTVIPSDTSLSDADTNKRSPLRTLPESQIPSGFPHRDWRNDIRS